MSSGFGERIRDEVLWEQGFGFSPASTGSWGGCCVIISSNLGKTEHSGQLELLSQGAIGVSQSQVHPREQPPSWHWHHIHLRDGARLWPGLQHCLYIPAKEKTFLMNANHEQGRRAEPWPEAGHLQPTVASAAGCSYGHGGGADGPTAEEMLSPSTHQNLLPPSRSWLGSQHLTNSYPGSSLGTQLGLPATAPRLFATGDVYQTPWGHCYTNGVFCVGITNSPQGLLCTRTGSLGDTA